MSEEIASEADDIFMMDRESAERIIEALATVDGETVRAALESVIQRKMGLLSSEVPEGDNLEAKFQRFFDMIVDVEPLPAEPYSVAELHNLFTKVAEAVRVEAASCVGTEDHDMESFYRGIAEDYAQLSKIKSLKKVIVAYKTLDTADREKLYWDSIGLDYRRWNVTLKAVDEYSIFI